MKITRRTILATSILALVSTTALAQQWTGGGDGVSWNQLANWTALPVSAPGANIVFVNAAAIITNQNLGNPFVLGALQAFGAGAVTVNGNPLDFDNGANDAVIVTVNPSFTIGAAVNMTSHTQMNNPGSVLTLSGGLSGPGQLRITQGLTILTGAGTWTGGTAVGFGSNQGTLRIAAVNALSGNVGISFNAMLEFASPAALSYGGTLNGQGTVKQSGPGTLTLTGNSAAWNGLVDVAGGILRVGSANALGGSFSTAQVASGATLELAVNDGLLPVANNVTVALGGTLDLAGFQQNLAINVTNNGTISLPGASTLAVGGFNVWTGGSSGTGSLSFLGNANLNPGTNLQHTGGTIQAGGFTQITGSNALPDTGLLQISGGFLTHAGTETVDSVLVNGGNLGTTTFNVTGSMDLQSGNTATSSTTITGAFTKTTAGTGTLSGGTFMLSGGGTVSAGQLDVNFTTINGAFLISGGTVNIGANSVLNGPTTNNNLLNITGGGTVAGTLANVGAVDVGGGALLSATINNTGLVSASGTSGIISGNITGPGQFFAASADTTLSGVNNYSGGSTLFGSVVNGNTDSIQGAWSLNALSVLNFTQNTNGTMSGQISGAGSVNLSGNATITLSGNNSFQFGVFITGAGTQFGVGSNTAAGSGGTIQGSDFKMSAEGGARTLLNPIVFGLIKTEFTGTNNLTLSNAGAKSLNVFGEILHTSTATTIVGGTFLGQNTTTINVNAGTLQLGAPVNNGFRMDGAINVALGATLTMISNSPVKLGPTNLNGGTLIAPSGVAVPTGLALTATGTIQGRVSSEAGSLIEATGPLTIGDATSFGGFFSNGELREQAQGVTLLDKNQAVLGSLTEVGTTSLPGLLTAANGVFVDFGRAITGYGIVAGNNVLADATIINGDAEGNSNVQPLDFTGYVKGIGTFTDVVFSGTFSPGLSPAIVPVNNVGFGAGNTLLMEIGGLTPGSQHDQIDIGGNLGLNGLLDVDLINGFNPSNGDFFNILDGTTSGTFSAFSFPSLNPGLSWDTSDLYTVGNLKIVPEPSAAMLMLAGAAALIRRRRR